MTEPIRVLSSFKAPRPTTNPYITMLDGALRAAPGVRMRRFSWLTALFGRYDVFHWHWPESRMHGSSWWKSAGLITLTAALALRHTASRRIAVVQTVHNVELPDVDPVRRWILRRIAATVDEAITLGDRIALLGTAGLVRREWLCGDDAGIRDGGVLDKAMLRAEILAEYRDVTAIAPSALAEVSA